MRCCRKTFVDVHEAFTFAAKYAAVARVTIKSLGWLDSDREWIVTVRV